MDRPDWVPEPAWSRLQTALCGQPAHARDTLADLTEVAATWDDAAREQLLERFLFHAERGVLLPAAFISSVWDLLDRDA